VIRFAQADKERDNAFSDLKGFLNGYRKLSSVANYQYAEDLYQIFKLFGLELYKLSYSSQTAQMKKLIEELEKPENIAKMTELSLTAAFNDMKTKQTAFETLFAEQAIAAISKSENSIRNPQRSGKVFEIFPQPDHRNERCHRLETFLRRCQ
jgi:hypothetical protein